MVFWLGVVITDQITLRFSDQGIDGGFYKADACSQSANGGALLIFYSTNIEETLEKVLLNGEISCVLSLSFPEVAVVSTLQNLVAMSLLFGLKV